MSSSKTHSGSRQVRLVIVGGGAAGIATAASVLNRAPQLQVTIVDPADKHYYQAAFTLVGGGCFSADAAIRDQRQVIPAGVEWIKAEVCEILPAENQIALKSGERLGYEYLVVCPGLQLHWAGIEGLESTLGQNGVSSNYLLPYARYTWQCLRNMTGGRALFTQPPMPIKCAGAPQKIAYLAAHHWESEGQVDKIDIEFHTATPALFGVAEFVPSLQTYIERYGIDLRVQSTLEAIDGPAKKAYFRQGEQRVESDFDFIHVVPPQRAPDFIRGCELADQSGWLAVDPATLRHPAYENVFGLGDVINAGNAKTAAAVRKQAPTVAENLLAVIDGRDLPAVYNGYGACPLTVERGKVVLAEFGYGGELLPSFPVDNTRPSRLAWVLKRYLMPPIYWDLMLKGREWLARPELVKPGKIHH